MYTQFKYTLMTHTVGKSFAFIFNMFKLLFFSEDVERAATQH